MHRVRLDRPGSRRRPRRGSDGERNERRVHGNTDKCTARPAAAGGLGLEKSAQHLASGFVATGNMTVRRENCMTIPWTPDEQALSVA